MNIDYVRYQISALNITLYPANYGLNSASTGTATQLDILVGIEDYGRLYDIQFIQTIESVEGSESLSFRLDVLGGSDRPFYDSRGNASQMIYGHRNSYGMGDAPASFNFNKNANIHKNIPSGTWTATTSIIGQFGEDGKWYEIQSFQWGFTIDATGTMRELLLQIGITPSQRHYNYFPK